MLVLWGSGGCPELFATKSTFCGKWSTKLWAMRFSIPIRWASWTQRQLRSFFSARKTGRRLVGNKGRLATSRGKHLRRFLRSKWLSAMKKFGSSSLARCFWSSCQPIHNLHPTKSLVASKHSKWRSVLEQRSEHSMSRMATWGANLRRNFGFGQHIRWLSKQCFEVYIWGRYTGQNLLL